MVVSSTDFSEVTASSPTIIQSLPPEVEEGNREYKLKLVDPTPCRIEHLITQMKWRLKEGDGEAIYAIGVEDNGAISGLLKEELDSSLATLQEMADRLGAETRIINEHSISYPNGVQQYATEVMVKKIPDEQVFVDIRVGCIGNVDVGKSTLLGVLSHGALDNGRGKARLNMFRHLHEIQTGRTSSISHEILGFDAIGKELNYSDSTVEEICASATKLITFLDLAGHHKYIKTTIFGLTGYSPEVVMLLVAANRGLAGTTKEHLGLAIALKIPFLIVITKTDLCSNESIDRTVQQLEKILKSPGCKKVPLLVEDENDAETAAANLNLNQITPIFKVSSVTGRNLPLLRKFYFLLPSLKSKMEQEKLIQEPTEFKIDEIFSVRDVGPVLAGTLKSGIIRVGDKLVIGPASDGMFQEIEVQSIHRNRRPTRVIQAGQTACIALVDSSQMVFRRGQVLLQSKDVIPKTCMTFEAELFLLFHTTKITPKFQATVHIGNIIQTAVIKSMDKEFLKTGQKAKVIFEFIGHPEYVRKGDCILFREGRCKGIGEVTDTIQYQPPV